MSDQMKTTTSKKGESYQYGVIALGEYQPSDPADPNFNGFKPVVHFPWPVGDRSWKPTFNIDQIDQFRLYRHEDAKDKAWEYRLEFTNTGGWGFTFHDEGGDSYFCSTIINGHHFIQYNSDKPEIMFID